MRPKCNTEGKEDDDDEEEEGGGANKRHGHFITQCWPSVRRLGQLHACRVVVVAAAVALANATKRQQPGASRDAVPHARSALPLFWQLVLVPV